MPAVLEDGLHVRKVSNRSVKDGTVVAAYITVLREKTGPRNTISFEYLVSIRQDEALMERQSISASRKMFPRLNKDDGVM